MRIIYVFLLLCSSASAQLWSGVLAPSRSIDWTVVGAGTIPNRTTICSTLNVGTTAALINTAITNCSNTGGGVVLLNAGTYTGMGGWNLASNVTLRGAGPNSTFVQFTSTVSCNGLGAYVCVNNGDNDFVGGGVQNRATWTGTGGVSGTYTVGSKSLLFGSVTVGTISNLHVGSTLILDQNQDNAVDPGDIYVSDAPTVIQLSGHTGCGDVVAGSAPRLQTQTVQVTSVTGTGPWTVGINPGVYAPNWRTAMAPGAFWANHVPITGVGIENISLDYSGGPNVSGGIFFADASTSWVKSVRSINNGATPVDKHIRIYQSHNITVRDSYFYGGSGAQENYAIADSFHSSNDLGENNIIQHVATATITECSSGSVFGYNYAADNNYVVQTNWQQQDATKHGGGESFNLWESQIGAGAMLDNLWGTSFMNTLFRNRFSGRDRSTKTAQTIAMNDYARNRFANEVGNVLGTSGYHTIYTSSPASGTDPGSSTNGDVSVFVVGFSGNEGTLQSSTVTNDLLTGTTLMRWGNYDTVNAAVRFVAGENGSGAVTYPALSNPSQTLPSSFYLTSKPSWWGAMPWPAIGPDVTGGNIANVGGHAYLTPAANCYLNIMGGKTDGTSGILAFNPTACYVGAGPPPPPSVVNGNAVWSGQSVIN